MSRPAPSASLSPWRDDRRRFGRISRWLHWSMAALLGWQFAGMLAKVGLGKAHVLTQWLTPSHSHIGILLLVLVVVRAVWGLTQLGRRPATPGWAAWAAWGGHLVLYALMLLVPLLATLRMLGNTRPFAWFGLLPLNDGTGERIEALVAPGNAWHGTLGWVLLALIVGHILFALGHRFLLNDDVAQRMIGRVRD